MSIFEEGAGSATAAALEVESLVPLVIGAGEVDLRLFAGAFVGGGEGEGRDGLVGPEAEALDEGPRGGERVRTGALESRMGDRERERVRRRSGRRFGGSSFKRLVSFCSQNEDRRWSMRTAQTM